ncbi:hypothetical protein C9I57_26740 [Trinickia symbiotica]|uniref:Uncharacterized protein n=1 Tax=Trinickia symbiotica TaxID=863227 RepID=A0A2T3XMT0_9BURK|nr:hypothetical protein [Trinickia symbiotica]PTB17810.1 hypothetical protein C9I57_26740 [Trinickia symbiotica]
MMTFVILCFLAGIVVAIPFWLVAQRFGARGALRVMHGFDPAHAVPCVMEPVVLKGRLLPDLEGASNEGKVSEMDGAR